MADTIAAVASGDTASSIGVIRISGDEAIEIADKVFRCSDSSSLTKLGGYRAKFGRVTYDGESFDDAVALIFRSPKSYTGEDVAEISVHGGMYIVQKTLESVLTAGARIAEAGEFTKRAFLNGKMDLAQAEGVAQIISAEGQEAAKASYNLMKGTLSGEISEILTSLLDCSALMAAWVDYPDEEIPELSPDELIKTLEASAEKLKALLDNYENGIIMTHGIDTVIAGRTNAGKSTLMNMLCKSEKSIVTQIEGTTRDVVEGTVRLGRLILRLSDTAGLRKECGEVEAIGIQKAMDRIESSALILAVFDCSSPLCENDELLIESTKGKRRIAVINKNDLDEKINLDVIKESFDEIVFMSAKNRTGAKELEEAIKRVIGTANFDSSRPMLANSRQKQCVQKAYDNIIQALDGAKVGITYDAVNVMIDSAVDELLSLTGQKASEEVINNIFSKFCVGK